MSTSSFTKGFSQVSVTGAGGGPSQITIITWTTIEPSFSKLDFLVTFVQLNISSANIYLIFCSCVFPPNPYLSHKTNIRQYRSCRRVFCD
jgi:hypothetical protein